MKTKIIALLMIAVVALSIISGCVEKNKNAPAVNNSVAISIDTPKPPSEAYVKAVVITPTPEPEKKIPTSETSELKISSLETIYQGEYFTVTLALLPQLNQKIVALETNIITDDKIKIISAEIIGSNPGADKIVQGGDISYADAGGISGDYAIIKFSAVQKGQTEIIVKATAIDENHLAAELLAKKTVKIA